MTRVSPSSTSISPIVMCFMSQNQLVLLDEPAIVPRIFDPPAACRPNREIKKTKSREGQAEV